jgi:cytochrome P450
MTSAITSYGDEHRRLRNLISTAFTPQRVESLRPRVRDIVDQLVRDLRGAESGQVVDLYHSFAYTTAAETICELLGLHEELRARTRRAIDGILRPTTPEQAQADFADLLACMGTLVAAKHADPGDDMTSDLIAARDGDTKLDGEETVLTLIMMIGAGIETTANLIANAVHALLTHPEQLQLVLAGQATWEEVIEETLRFEGPIQHMPLRYAIEDIDLGEDTLIKAGEPILLAFGAAGRDPSVHGDKAGQFDITRTDPCHIAFGHGVHHCIGAPLARMEAAIALPALFEHFPAMNLAVPADQLQRQASFIANGLQELPVHPTLATRTAPTT